MLVHAGGETIDESKINWFATDGYSYQTTRDSNFFALSGLAWVEITRPAMCLGLVNVEITVE